MIQVELPKDISKIEKKYMNLVTGRQAVGIIIATILTFIMRSKIGEDSALYPFRTIFTFVTAGVPLLLFCANPYGMSCFAFVKQYIYTNILSSSKRKYVIKNEFYKENEKELKDEEFIIQHYNKVKNIKVRNGMGDPMDKPLLKKHKNKGMTGFY